MIVGEKVPGCPECENPGPIMDHAAGELVCEGCGLVVTSTIIDNSWEWRAYTLSEYQKRTWMQNESGVGVGVIIVLRYLNRPSVVEEVSAGHQEFKGIITSIHQRYFEGNKMLEIIEVEGMIGEIKQLTQEIMAKKGVKQVKASIIAP